MSAAVVDNGGWELSESGGSLYVGGAVNFDNFGAIRASGEQFIRDNGRLSVNFGRIEGANSVTVGLMLAWFREADLQGNSIVFVDVPRDLRNIIDFSGLSAVLPFESGALDDIVDHASEHDESD
ncbi:MAG: hypothetical protein QF921_12310 [Pseudomonadales bacterium]|jgi:ABC-type transporter Mla MlaB component|nr:hypothetical protein [Pseudomonadales bacterium]MDP6470855.1 hypothetical protein [Pseudomonadales bacterium]MDP6825960.1 hypothetical protein [Pseudomonadales bacterium]MDP6972272.1 hypothetical protein [Pseudomonadales bacterium]|tara:strand:+ start:2281 stop:2652 length:372 start_codon:yes stop_codon:yes gene_type:complete